MYKLKNIVIRNEENAPFFLSGQSPHQYKSNLILSLYNFVNG